MSDLIDAKEAAEILKVSRQWVTKLIRANLLKAERVGGQWVIERSEVQWHSRQRRQAAKGK
jgi:excisionase family DNA binding protein